MSTEITQVNSSSCMKDKRLLVQIDRPCLANLVKLCTGALVLRIPDVDWHGLPCNQYMQAAHYLAD